MKQLTKKTKRNANGEGGLRQDKRTGNWEGTYTLYRQDGTAIKKSFTRATRNEILDIKAKLRLMGILENNVATIEIDRHTDEIRLLLKGQNKNSIGLSKDITVAEYVDYYLETHRRNGLNGKKVEDTTFSSYVDKGKLIKKYIGNMKVKDLTFEELDNFINTLNREVSDTTAKQTRDIVTKMMFFAKKDGVVKENVLQDEKITIKERKGKTEKKIIQEEDIVKYIKCCMEYKYYDLIFLLNTRN